MRESVAKTVDFDASREGAAMPSFQLNLLPIDEVAADRLAQDHEAFESDLGVSTSGAAELLRDVARQTVELARREPRDPMWGGFFVVDELQRSIVGIGGYRAAPTAAGEVEIAYGTLPAWEGRGYATAIAHELTRRAFAIDSVARVIAHTSSADNASAHILQRNGFRLAGEVNDPEDGPVCQWRRERSE